MKREGRTRITYVLALLLALALVTNWGWFGAMPALAQTPTPESGPAAAATPTLAPLATPDPNKPPLIIGAVFNATGWMATYDQLPRSAALLAIEDINARGGVLGRALKLIELDGKTDPATVGNAARQLISQGAEVIIAPCDFDIGAPASQAAQEKGLVGISTCATSPLYSSKVLGDKQFTVGMWNNIMGAAMAEYGYEKLNWRTAYIVTDTSTDYATSLGDYFEQHFTQLGGRVIGRDTFTAGDQDFSAQVQRIKGLSPQPDVLYITGTMPDLGIVLRQVRAAGITIPLAGGDTYDDTELYKTLGPELANDLYMATHSWLGPEAGGEMARFVQLYKDKYGEPPSSAFIVMGWDVIKIIAQAVEKAGTTEGAALAKAMEEMEFDLLSGKLKWSDAESGHQPQKEAAIVVVQGGQPQFLGWMRPTNPPQP
ncbi:MAG: ABC transporter substrate-binding protein [Anaerolineae bacterium]|nr:ABC transporter substrate-binding protein [Anaerolineae bacterium]MDW8070482.1 ABC transporter substrate-binding protein [Anaerolineae bacterium]